MRNAPVKFRDNESPAPANLLRLIDEMAPGEPGEVPEGSELLVADQAQPSP